MQPKLLRIKKSIQRTYQFEDGKQARDFLDLMEGFELVAAESRLQDNHLRRDFL